MQTTIVEYYREDRKAAAREKKPVGPMRRVWRMYAISMLEEMKRRGNPLAGDQFFRWRKAEGDDELPIPFLPYWREISDKDLLDLYRSLERAKVGEDDDD